MGRRLKNPSPLAVAAAVTLVGVGGYLVYEHMSEAKATPKKKPTKSVEHTIPKLTLLGDTRAKMFAEHPDADCFEKGGFTRYSVTGPEDGAAFEYEAYGLPSEEIVLVYEYRSPYGGGGHGRPVYRSWEDALTVIREIRAQVAQAYEERQDELGRPHVTNRGATWSTGC
jgi:hypothetical protein